MGVSLPANWEPVGQIWSVRQLSFLVGLQLSQLSKASESLAPAYSPLPLTEQDVPALFAKGEGSYYILI